MNLDVILFILFGSISAVTAVLMITRNNPVIAALFLILNFASLAGLYLLLNAQFIAVVQVIVYAGAIMVLFLFVLMLLRPEHEKNFMASNPAIKIFSYIIAGVVFFQLAYMIFFSKPYSTMTPSEQMSINSGTVEKIGLEMFTNYVLPFEAAGFLLLAAVIGSLVLAKKKFD